MEDELPKPSEVRSEILAQHAALRERLDALEVISAQLREDKTSAQEAFEAAEALYRDLVKHVRAEERLLVPALREADGFGPARVEELQREHAEQATILSDLMNDLGALAEADDATHVAERVNELIVRIREDMEEEERHHLSRHLLKDDLITGAFGG
ncbi:MAG: hemerythrin domain-containing protein [Myxococcales bacterium]|nr:hemerythrin domain-containing protein [Myxococcales bacterium]